MWKVLVYLNGWDPRLGENLSPVAFQARDLGDALNMADAIRKDGRAARGMVGEPVPDTNGRHLVFGSHSINLIEVIEDAEI